MISSGFFKELNATTIPAPTSPQPVSLYARTLNRRQFGLSKFDFVLNLQGGVTFGDVPPYESLILGGSSSVRGFSRGEVGSGNSFSSNRTIKRW